MNWFRNQWIGTCLLAYAPAKLNLTLRVTGKRADGFHDLRSLVVAVDLVDTLVFSPGRGAGIELEVNVPELQRADNLVLRAVRLVCERAGLASDRVRTRVYLHKRIPHGAGLGGGSSDASCALRAARDWFAIRVSDMELVQLSAQLGSDCPFFACRTGAALVEGRGEVVRPLKLGREIHFVVVWPKAPLSTAKVFAHHRLNRGGANTEEELLEALRSGVRDQSLQPLLQNDLFEAAATLCPTIGEIVDLLRSSGTPAAMSGSGSAVFAIAPDSQIAVEIARRLRRETPHFVATARSLE